MIPGPMLERTVLQAVTSFPHLVEEVGLEARDFLDENRQRYLSALRETRHYLPNGSAAALEVALRAGLDRRWVLEELNVSFDVPAQARDAVRQLRLDSLAQRLGSDLRQAMISCRGADLLARTADLSRRYQIAAESSAAEVTDMETVTRSYIASELRRLETGARVAFSTGLRGLDQAIRGWRPGEMTTLVATGGAGKSTLANWWRRHLAMRGLYSLTFAGEMSEEQEGERLAYAECRQNLDEELSDAVALADADERIAASGSLRFMLLKARSRFKPNEVRATIEAEKAKRGGLALVVLDHLRHLDVECDDRSDYALVSAAAAEWKAITKDTKTAGVLITHLRTHVSRGGDYSPPNGKGEEPEPDPSMIRGSGRIFEESDNVLCLWRPVLPALYVFKARQTGVKGRKISLGYDPKTQDYSEVDA